MCGAAKVEITPAFAMHMGGYSCRRELSHGTHDPLYVRALALEYENLSIILLSFDLLAVDDLITASLEKLRSLAVFGSTCPVFLPAATHTHHGPDGFPPNVRFGEWCRESYIVPEYRTALTENIQKAVVAAWERRVRCDMYLGYGVSTFGLNRRNPKGSNNDLVTLLRFAPKNKPRNTKAAVIHYTCHPTTMPRHEAVFSADYPGAAITLLEDRLCGSCLFFNGACGDVSTRYSRREESPAETQRFGGELAQAVLYAMQSERLLTTSLTYASGKLFAGDKKHKTALLGFGGKDGLKAFFIPGELFSSTAEDWSEKYRGLSVWGYALGYAGYIPDADAYKTGGYEVEASQFNESEAVAFLKDAEEFLNMNYYTEEM